MESRIEPSAQIQIIDYATLKFDSIISEGAFGQVYAGHWNNTPCAIKFYTSFKFSDAILKASFEEESKYFAFLKEKNVPNIIGFYGVVKNKFNYLVMEYTPEGDLQTFIDNQYEFPRLIRYQIMLDITLAVKYIHSFDLLHNDLKPDNILITNNHAKLCDLGLMKTCEEASRKKSRYGTELFVAPEIRIAQRHVTKGSDMYTLALSFWSMINKAVPFVELDSYEDVHAKKLTGNPVTIPKTMNRRVARFFKECWQIDADQRPGAEKGIVELEKARDHKSKLRKS